MPSIDFIKIDVEGFELDVVEGLAETIKRYKPIVVLEMNHWCLNVFQRICIPDFLDKLRTIFPLLYAVQEDRYVDLNSADNRYMVMYRHILSNEFANLVGAFHPGQLSGFYADFSER